jgi:AAA domain
MLKPYARRFVVEGGGELRILDGDNIKAWGSYCLKSLRVLEFSVEDVDFVTYRGKVDQCDSAESPYLYPCDEFCYDLQRPEKEESRKENKEEDDSSAYQKKLNQLENKVVKARCAYTIRTPPKYPVGLDAHAKCNIKIGNTTSILLASGVCQMEGRLPFLAPYVTYSAICAFILKPRVGQKSQNPHFEVVQILDLKVRVASMLRFLDVKYICDWEIKRPHLYGSLIDQVLHKHNKEAWTIAGLSGKTVPRIRHRVNYDDNGDVSSESHSLNVNDVWDDQLLDPRSPDSKLYFEGLETSTWSNLAKFALVWSAYPNLASFMYRNLSDAKLAELSETLKNGAVNWKIALSPLLMPGNEPKIYGTLFTNCFNDPFSPSPGQQPSISSFSAWLMEFSRLPTNKRISDYFSPNESAMSLTLSNQKKVRFYHEVILRKLQKGGSSLATLSSQVFVKELTSRRYFLAFGVVKSTRASRISKFDDLMGVFVKLCLIRNVEPEGLKKTTLQLIRELTGCKDLSCGALFPSNPNDKSNERISAPNCDSYATNSSWLDDRNIAKRLLHLKLQRMRDGIPSSFSSPLDKFSSRINSEGKYEFDRPLGGGEFDATELSKEQTYALLYSLLYPVTCVVGLPGTGKTLVIEAIFEIHLGPSGEDLGKVAVVTHGGCMADELERRGLKRAKTIQMCLEDVSRPRNNHSSPNDDDDDSVARRLFDYASVEVLIIDEFSNVSDQLAASVYKEGCFPNLKSIVHVYDPMQTAPLETGALSLDYMSSFPTLDYVNYQISKDERLGSFRKKDGSEESSGEAARAKVLALVELMRNEKAALLLRDHVPLGVVQSMRLIKRYEKTSSISQNGFLLLRGCKSPFVFDMISTFQYPCYTLLDPEEMDRKMGKRLGKSCVKLDVTLKFVEKNLLSNPLGERLCELFFTDTVGGVMPHFLALTNRHCETLNKMCELLEAMSRSIRIKCVRQKNLVLVEEEIEEFEKRANGDCDTEIKDDVSSKGFGEASPNKSAPKWEVRCNRRHKTREVKTGIGFGWKLLSREKHVGEKIVCDVVNTLERLKATLFYCNQMLKVPPCLIPKSTDAMSKDFAKNFRPNSTPYMEVDSDDPDALLKIDYKDKFVVDWNHCADHIMLELQKDTLQYSNISVTPLFNGTSFTVSGFVALKTGPILPEDILRRLVLETGLIVDRMGTALLNVSGVGAKAKRRDIRREAIKQYQNRRSVTGVFEILKKLETRRWIDLASNHGCRLKSRKLAVSCGSRLDGEFWQRNGKGCIEDDCKVFMVGTGGTFLRLTERFFWGNHLDLGWATTVNYAQGKEYDDVCLVLPEYKNPSYSSKGARMIKSVHSTFAHFNRSHIHVAQTRGRKTFTLFGNPQDLREIGSRRETRATLTSAWLPWLIEANLTEVFRSTVQEAKNVEDVGDVGEKEEDCVMEGGNKSCLT